MPRPKSATVPRLDPLAEIRQLRARQAALQDDLRAKRGRLLAEVSEIDEALSEMGVGARAVAALVPNPARAPSIPRQPKATPAARVPEAKGIRAGDPVAAELVELLPWIDALKNDRQRQAIRLRAGGMSPAAVAAKLGCSNKDVGNDVVRGRKSMREARTKGKPGETPASDDEPAPAPAPAPPVNDNAAPASVEVEKEEQSRAPTGWDRSDPGEDFTDIEPPVTQVDPLLAILKRPEGELAPAANDGDDGDAIPTLERAREHLTAKDNGCMRARTISAPRLSRAERRAGEDLDYPADVQRPITRGDCLEGPRPCPFVSCSHHLYLDVNPESGTIKLNFPHLEVDQMAETCSLDVADRGGITLEEVGVILNLTHERIRQIEVRGLDTIRDGDDFEEVPEHRGSPLAEAIED